MLKKLLQINEHNQHLDILSEILKSVCYLSKATFDKNEGIDSIYIK